MTSSTKNQGEGDKISAKRYNEKSQEFVRKNADEIEEQAESAKAELQKEGDGAALTAAEEEARSRAKEFDPAVSNKS